MYLTFSENINLCGSLSLPYPRPQCKRKFGSPSLFYHTKKRVSICFFAISCERSSTLSERSNLLLTVRNIVTGPFVDAVCYDGVLRLRSVFRFRQRAVIHATEDGIVVSDPLDGIQCQKALFTFCKFTVSIVQNLSSHHQKAMKPSDYDCQHCAISFPAQSFSTGRIFILFRICKRSAKQRREYGRKSGQAQQQPYQALFYQTYVPSYHFLRNIPVTNTLSQSPD